MSDLPTENPAKDGFAPPPAPPGAGRVYFLRDVWNWSARRMAERLQEAGIDADWASNRESFQPVVVEGVRENFYHVSVPQSQLICAMVLWKAGRGGAEAWGKLAGFERRRLAEIALVDAMLLSGGSWSESWLTHEGLAWLKGQLGLGEEGFQRILGQARERYLEIGRRDLRWGTRLAAVCLLASGVIYWTGILPGWQALVLLVLGAVFGLHTLAYSLPRAGPAEPGGLGGGHPSLAEIRARAARMERPPDEPEGIAGLMKDLLRAEKEMAEAAKYSDEKYFALARAIDEAGALFRRGDPSSAIAVLKDFTSQDHRGIHSAYPEFFDILRKCERGLGLSSKEEEAGTEEMNLDWAAALAKGREALSARKPELSIKYFKMSLKANPGEYGSANSCTEAEEGIKAAEALLKQRG